MRIYVMRIFVDDLEAVDHFPGRHDGVRWRVR